MNTGRRPLLVVDLECQLVTERIIREVEKAGLHTLRSFDLASARASRPGCTCPEHGSEECSCHLVILLILLQGRGPLTVILEGKDKHTTIYLEAGQNDVEEKVEPSLTIALFRATGM